MEFMLLILVLMYFHHKKRKVICNLSSRIVFLAVVIVTSVKLDVNTQFSVAFFAFPLNRIVIVIP